MLPAECTQKHVSSNNINLYTVANTYNFYVVVTDVWI